MHINNRARLQFIRSVNVIKTDYYVIGGFIRNVLNGCDSTCKLQMAFVNLQLGSLLRELEILGLIHDTDMHSLTSDYCLTRSTVILKFDARGDDLKMVTFDVELMAMTRVPKIITMDAIALTSSGLILLEKEPLFDYLNANHGIALMDRLVDLSEKSINLLKPLIAQRGSAETLRFVGDILAESLDVKGIMHTSDSRECPVCMENNRLLTLRCKHSFCGGCLASHIECEHAKCPLCRAVIKLF
ncbi:hypothetical protein EB118_08825 [bacterium]|nr:hypothetical protein [bacterium]NDC94657.1 hypothetical protein [bacterium]NDD84299.1 hypothetical protein [bacterium]NDG30165.1 hypothetical protein [bacterium]